jgi:hypothetical protein
MPLWAVETVKNHIRSISVHEVEKCQEKIISTIKRLSDRGEISLDGYQFEIESTHMDLEAFEATLITRQQEDTYISFFRDEITMCRFFNSKNSEELLADIEQKNEEQGMGNIKIPHTKIKLINYSVCPKCGHIFSFKDLTDYYANPRPDSIFKNKKQQFREDTRIYCPECFTYFLPALVISDGTPRNEVQFLCRIQTMNAIETYYHHRRTNVLSANKENRVYTRYTDHKTFLTGIKNDILLKDLESKPALVGNLFQYTPANLVLNLIDGSNIEKGDVLFGSWCKCRTMNGMMMPMAGVGCM